MNVGTPTLVKSGEAPPPGPTAPDERDHDRQRKEADVDDRDAPDKPSERPPHLVAVLEDVADASEHRAPAAGISDTRTAIPAPTSGANSGSAIASRRIPALNPSTRFQSDEDADS